VATDARKQTPRPATNGARSSGTNGAKGADGTMGMMTAMTTTAWRALTIGKIGAIGTAGTPGTPGTMGTFGRVGPTTGTTGMARMGGAGRAEMIRQTTTRMRALHPHLSQMGLQRIIRNPSCGVTIRQKESSPVQEPGRVDGRSHRIDTNSDLYRLCGGVLEPPLFCLASMA